MPATRNTAKAAPRGALATRTPATRTPATRTPRKRPAAVKPVVTALQEVMHDPAGSQAEMPLAALPSDDASSVTSFIPLARSEPASEAEGASGTDAMPTKTATSGKTARTAKGAANADKARKPKLVRDSFTIPKPEYAVIEALKLRAASLGKPAKKSEVLRAGLKALEAMSDDTLLANLAAVPRVKTGRPAKA